MKWSAGELNLMDKMLEDGLKLEVLHSFLPNKTLDSVYRKCTNLGYGKYTDNEGVTRLRLGVRPRRMKTKAVSSIRVAVTTQKPTALKSTVKDSSGVIIPDNDINDVLLNANTRAVNILTENTLPPAPDIVQTLAKFILSNNKEIR